VKLWEKIIAEYIPNIPEADREKFIATARAIILDRNAGNLTPSRIIAEANGTAQYRQEIGKIGSSRYDDAKKIQEETIRKLTEEKRELTEKKRELTNVKWKLIEEAKKDIREYETLLLTQTKNLSLTEIKQNRYDERTFLGQEAEEENVNLTPESENIMRKLGIR
jgi:hypothetical protein